MFSSKNSGGQDNHKLFSPVPMSPEKCVPGYNVPGYMRLLSSIPSYEKKQLLSELDSPEVTERAQAMVEKYARGTLPVVNLDESRQNFVAALKCLQQGKLTVEQVASLHIWDSAIRLYYTNDGGFKLVYEFVQEGNRHKTVFMTPVSGTNRPTSLTFAQCGTTNRDIYNSLASSLQNVNIPLVKRYFNLTDVEYRNFCDAMQKAPASEQFCIMLITPQEGCISGLLPKINQVVTCMQDMMIWMPTNDGGADQVKVTLAPSFTMLQAVLDVKAKTLVNAPVQLIPTYFMLEHNDYARLKLTRQIAVGLYLPDKFHMHSVNDPNYLQNIDGHAHELPYATIMHDFYHALRELTMTKNVADARWRLTALLGNSDVVTKIIDGELINSYKLSVDTIRTHITRSEDPQIFGDLFKLLKLTPEQKLACIKDMVINRDEWRKNFNIGYRDLTYQDQEIYFEFASQCYYGNNLKDDSLFKKIDDLDYVRHHVEKLKIDVNAVHYFYKTRAIDCAIQKGNINVIQYLMSQGARLFDHDGNTAANAMCWLASYMRNSRHDATVLNRLIALFLKNIPCHPKSGLTTSHVKALRGELPAPHDVHHADAFGCLPIHYAIMSGKITLEWFRHTQYNILASVKDGMYQGMSILSLLLCYDSEKVALELFSMQTISEFGITSAFELLNTRIYVGSISVNYRDQVGTYPSPSSDAPNPTLLEVLAKRKSNEILMKLCSLCTIRERSRLKLHKHITDDNVLSEIMTYAAPKNPGSTHDGMEIPRLK